ncbi:hypothetical protein [Rhodopirellula sp. MGV]|uniref:hypothetical protein n=1 Tax=Rhodopirellula sp. MGV TaxID=2023130 RepID=UPI00117B11CB|nr:hypothetical protein [Rhodopirellula sp. MGV]
MRYVPTPLLLFWLVLSLFAGSLFARGMFAAIGDQHTASADGEPSFSISSNRDDDEVTVNVDDDTVLFSLRSPRGIGRATIERNDEHWPPKIKLRLYLNGLEKFKLVCGDMTLEASIVSQTGKFRVWKGGSEDSPLDRESPFWIKLDAFDEDGKPIALKPPVHGYFELQLPKAAFAENAKTITLHWIDFYR